MPLPWYGTIILITPDFMLLNFGLSNHGWEDDCHMYIIRYSDWIIYQCHFLIRYRFKYHARRLFGQISLHVALSTPLNNKLYFNVFLFIIYFSKMLTQSLSTLGLNAHFVQKRSEDNQTDWFITFLTFKFCAERKMLP